jgi:hypothetical protein
MRTLILTKLKKQLMIMMIIKYHFIQLNSVIS